MKQMSYWDESFLAGLLYVFFIYRMKAETLDNNFCVWIWKSKNNTSFNILKSQLTLE